MCVFLSFCEMLKFWKCSCYFWVFVFIIFACSSCFASPIIFFSLFRNNNIADLWKFAITTTVTTSTWLGLVLILGTVISCWASDRSPFAAKFNAPHLELPPLFPPHTRPPSLSHTFSRFSQDTNTCQHEHVRVSVSHLVSPFFAFVFLPVHGIFGLFFPNAPLLSFLLASSILILVLWPFFFVFSLTTESSATLGIFRRLILSGTHSLTHLLRTKRYRYIQLIH